MTAEGPQAGLTLSRSVAATPVGMRVTAQVKLAAAEDHKPRFKAECRDEKEIIGTGFH